MIQLDGSELEGPRHGRRASKSEDGACRQDGERSAGPACKPSPTPPHRLAQYHKLAAQGWGIGAPVTSHPPHFPALPLDSTSS